MSHKQAKRLLAALKNERGIDVKEIVDHGKGEGRCPDSGRSIYSRIKGYIRHVAKAHK